MRALSRILLTSLALACALPLLGAVLGCSDCEDFCQQEYDGCSASSGITDDPARCHGELNECLRGCESEPSGWDDLDELGTK